MILRGIFRGVSRFTLHFMLYRGNFDCFSNSMKGRVFSGDSDYFWGQCAAFHTYV